MLRKKRATELPGWPAADRPGLESAAQILERSSRDDHDQDEAADGGDVGFGFSQSSGNGCINGSKGRNDCTENQSRYNSELNSNILRFHG